MAPKVVAIVFCLTALQLGCGSTNDDAEQSVDGSAGSVGQDPDSGVDARTDSQSNQEADKDAAPLFPNNIRFTTCETDPQEVAIPNGADKGTCDRVTATAFHVEHQTAIEVPSSFAWTVDDSAVAFFPPPQDTDTGETRRLLSLIDIFTAPSAEEPWATLQACALPLNGTGQVEPVCGTLTIHAVVNLAGTWCFQGATFQGDCDKRQIEQDGRGLTSTTLGKGKVQGREVSFSGLGPTYQAELSDADHMSGTAFDQNTQQALGQWSAKRDNPAQ